MADFGPGPVSLDIPVGVSGVTSVFTLINTMWGQPGPHPYLYITFNGSGGAALTEPLLGGTNVRDYNDDGYTNTINDTTTTLGWTNGLGQRLDRQEFILPAAFANEVLTRVVISDLGNENFSRACLSGLTVSTCQSLVTEDTLFERPDRLQCRPEALHPGRVSE